MVNIGTVLSKAVMHDVEECITGDINRPFKYSSTDVAETLHSAAIKATRKALDTLQLDGHVQHNLGHIWHDAKDNTKEGRIVKFADYLSVLSYMAEELSQNMTMRSNREEMRKYALIFEYSDFDFIRPLVNQSKEILEDAFKANTSTR